MQQEGTQPKKEVRPEVREYQKRISDMLEIVIKKAEDDCTGALLDLKSSINEHPELSAYMAEQNGIAWVMLLFTLDKFNSPQRLGDMLSDIVGVDIDRKTLQKELGHIEAMTIKSMLNQQIQEMMLMAKFKNMMKDSEAGVQIMGMDGLKDILSPGGGGGNPPS